MALEITKDNLQEVLDTNEFVVLDFGADWCGPCKILAPIIATLAEENAGKAIISKIDVDKHKELAAKYSIRNIPTILFFKNAIIVDKHTGMCSKSYLQAKIDGLTK